MFVTEQQESVSTVSIIPLVLTVNAVRMGHGATLRNSNVKVLDVIYQTREMDVQTSRRELKI